MCTFVCGNIIRDKGKRELDEFVFRTIYRRVSELDELFDSFALKSVKMHHVD
jgi:hypothetical protein